MSYLPAAKPAIGAVVPVSLLHTGRPLDEAFDPGLRCWNVGCRASIWLTPSVRAPDASDKTKRVKWLLLCCTIPRCTFVARDRSVHS